LLKKNLEAEIAAAEKPEEEEGGMVKISLNDLDLLQSC